jgi:hypothetical protein
VEQPDGLSCAVGQTAGKKWVPIARYAKQKQRQSICLCPEMKRETMTNEELRQQYEERARAEEDAGGYVIIELGTGAIDVRLSSGEEYYFSNGEAQELLSEVPDWIDPISYIMATAQNW